MTGEVRIRILGRRKVASAPEWSSSWKPGTAVMGDATIVPHKGKRAGKLRQFVPRKPHSTGLKLYCMSDAVRPCIMDMYLFEGRRGVVRNATNDCVGKNTPTQMVQHWQSLAPSESILVCDSYFGSPNTAPYLTSATQSFVLLAKRNDHGVGELGASLREGEDAGPRTSRLLCIVSRTGK